MNVQLCGNNLPLLLLLSAGFDVNKVGDARVGFVGGWQQ
jgi:hypothetical protein